MAVGINFTRWAHALPSRPRPCMRAPPRTPSHAPLPAWPLTHPCPHALSTPLPACIHRWEDVLDEAELMLHDLGRLERKAKLRAKAGGAEAER